VVVGQLRIEGGRSLPDAKQSKPSPSRPAPPLDPRLALAQQYLNAAKTDAAEKEAAQPRAHRERENSQRRRTKAFTLSIAPATLVHTLLAAFGLTFAALSMTLTYHLLMVNFVAGRVVALPTGIIVAAALGYLSVCFLGIIESTSTGHTNVDSLEGDWQEWFWTLPSTLGMLALAAAVGWILSLVSPTSVWLLIGLCALVLYPVFQLSSLEAGSAVVPLSLPVALSFVKHPLGWFVVYAASFALANVLWFLGRATWRDPPYVAILIVGPLAAIALFFYAWLLGQLAHLISTENES
jgi:hypothetical protein